MTRLKLGPQTLISVVLALLLFFSVAWQSALAQEAPRPAGQPPAHSAAAPAALSTTLSYYFISGNTFTAPGLSFYNRQVTGCMNQVNKGVIFSAPVHLPQASLVVSMTLFTYDSVMTDTISTGQFVFNNGQGLNSATLSASSAPQVMGFQHQQNAMPNPTIIDNQNYAYQVDWQKSGTYDSPQLSLCGVRLAYYAPAGATFLPLVDK